MLYFASILASHWVPARTDRTYTAWRAEDSGGRAMRDDQLVVDIGLRRCRSAYTVSIRRLVCQGGEVGFSIARESLSETTRIPTRLQQLGTLCPKSDDGTFPQLLL